MDITKAALHVYVVQEGFVRALCWVRGEVDGNSCIQLWAHAVQPLVVCNVAAGQNPLEALNRKIEVNLGGAFLDEMEDLESQMPLLFNGYAHWWMKIEWEFFNRMALLAPTTGGVRFMKQKDLHGIVNLNDINPTKPVPYDVNAMFTDEKEAMIKLWPSQQ